MPETEAHSAIHRERAPVRAYPANVTFNTLIAHNKRNSIFLMLCMSLLLVILGAVLGAVVGGRAEALVPAAIAGAAVFALIATGASLWSFFGGSEAVLKISGARLLKREEDTQLDNVVEELAIAAGIPKPKIYVMDSPAMNAFATGRDPEHGVVAITTGLREKLNRDELAGVMAHEISHIRHYDIRFAMLMATMVGLIVFACDAFWHSIRFGAMTRGGRRSSGGKGNAGQIIIIVIAVVLMIIAPILATMIRLAVSRQREYLADAGAVELTRYPQGMIGALEKLGGCKEPLKSANRATAHMFIVNPLKGAMKGKGHELSSHFRTHPPLKDRIARLKALLSEET